jgi:geranylgeranyl reductase family protein
MTPTTPPAAADEEWDLVVVGAGPAGAATALGALRAAPHLRVLLLDRQDFPRDKSCGDGIAPHVIDALRSVGAQDVVDGWQPLRRLSLARNETTVSRTMARDVWVIPREVFDARLVEHATRAGARLRRHRVRALSRAGVVDGRIRGDVVVGADGAHSVVRAELGMPTDDNRALAIRGYAPTAPARQGEQLIVFGDRRQPSYAWSFDRGDGLCNVGYGERLGAETGSDDGPSRTLLLDELERLIPGAASTGTDWRAHHLPLSGWSFRQPEGRLLLTGDAAGLVNPMTGEGIYYAVASGILAGRAAAEAITSGAPHTAGDRHRAAMRALIGRNLQHTSVCSRLARSPHVVAAAVRASDRDQRIFDDLVEIGLGQGLITPRLAAALVTSLGRSAVRAARTGTAAPVDHRVAP